MSRKYRKAPAALQALAATFVAMFFIANPPAARAHHLLPQHTLNCSENFPCPKAIRPRVRFWIEAFRTWDNTTAVLHDRERPARVYAIFNSGDGCKAGARKVVERERNKIKNALLSVAKKVAAGQKITGRTEYHLWALFPSQNPREIRRAAEKIRCQTGVRDGFVAGLARFNRFAPMVDQILSENKLPAEIRYLPFVESSYNPAAYSKAGAAGMWQIMPKTARHLGLELNATLDERLEPEAATRAAAKYLVDANRSLLATARETKPDITPPQLNPFIITSYNYGVNGMRRAIRAVGPDYMAVLSRYKSPSFQIAVKNFYASFLAARHVALNAAEYFGAPATAEPGGYQTVVLQHPTSIERVKSVFGLGEDELRPLNRALTRFIWRGWRLIPAGYRLHLPANNNEWHAEREKLAALAPERVIAGGDKYTVHRGDTACGIARALRVNCSELIRANNLGKRALIRVGQKLTIPRKLVLASGDAAAAAPAATDTTTAAAEKTAAASPATAVPATKVAVAAESYRVRRGDTACGIAEKLGVSCRALISHNRLGRRAVIHPGQVLFASGAGGRGLTPDLQYIVRGGDTACQIAERFNVRCAELRAINRLNKRAVIHPGQKLKIPGLVVPATSKTAQQLASAKVDSKDADTLRNLLDTLPDYGISVRGPANAPAYSMRIEADETLGHVADWLGIGSSDELQKLNNLRHGDELTVGQRLRLPVLDARAVERFERQRTDYHQVLSEELKEHYDLVGIRNYQVRDGDSPWSLSVRLGFPVWLLYRLNPHLREEALRPGQTVLLPKLTAKG